MNEQMQNTLSELINKTISTTEAVVEFGKQEIPIVIEQLLMWKMTEAVFTATVTFLIIFLFFFLWRKDYKRCDKTQKPTLLYYYGYDTDTPRANDNTLFGYRLIGGFISAISFLVLFCSLKNIIYIWVAPKIYLLEYGANLAGKASGG